MKTIVTTYPNGVGFGQDVQCPEIHREGITPDDIEIIMNAALTRAIAIGYKINDPNFVLMVQFK